MLDKIQDVEQVLQYMIEYQIISINAIKPLNFIQPTLATDFEDISKGPSAESLARKISIKVVFKGILDVYKREGKAVQYDHLIKVLDKLEIV